MAGHGQEALVRLREQRPTLVITDVNMPEMDGYDLCRRIKSDEMLQDLPVILLTSLSDPKDVLKGIECGADSFVVKPYDEGVILSRIEHLIAQLPLGRRTESSTVTEILYEGQRYTIDTGRTHSVELLLSTYEIAVQRNRQLAGAKQQLERQADELRSALEAAAESYARLKEAQMHLIEAEKGQTVGRLAAGIAHEVKNPLAILQVGMDWLGKASFSEDGGQAEIILNEMKDAVERASLVISDLLTLSAPHALEMGEACINTLIEKTLRFVKHDLAKAKVSVVKALSADLPKCRVDSNKILQVLINLFVNAIHAMPDGGTLTIKTRKSVMEADDTDYQSSGASGSRYRAGDTVVEIEIKDTGAGILDEDLNKIFVLFFTTKPAGQGTGLGLPVTKQIVDLHRGLLNIHNAAEGGVVATITFTQTCP